MNDIAEFLAHAIALENEAATRYADLAENMKTYGDQEVASFFSKMAEFSRMHLADARKRAHFRKLPDIDASEFQWPDGDSPEAASMEGSHYLMTVDYALALALEGERRSFAFYDQIAKATEDPEVRMMAEEFASEEAEHVAELEKWTARFPKKA